MAYYAVQKNKAEKGIPRAQWDALVNTLQERGISEQTLRDNNIWHLKVVSVPILQFKVAPQPFVPQTGLQRLFFKRFERAHLQDQAQQRQALAEQFQEKLLDVGLVRILDSAPVDHCCGRGCHTCGNRGGLWDNLPH